MDSELAFVAEALHARRIERGARIQSLWGGYGELHRVLVDDHTVVVKSVHPPAHDSGISYARKCASYDVELAFYRRFAARCDDGCRVPRLLAARRDEGPRWLLVLEDLDAAGFAGRLRRAPSEAHVDRGLRWLAAFHARFFAIAPEGLWPTGTYWHLETRRDELARISDRSLRAAAEELDARLSRCPFQTLVHGDAKLANFCFGARGVAAVDFQYVGAGVGVRDVAYFLGSGSDDSHVPDEERRLDAYFAYLRAALPAHVDGEAVERAWRALYPIAFADLCRFLAGWSPEWWARDRVGQARVREILRGL